MDEREEMQRRIREGNFIENTGRVLRAINVLRHEYHKLGSIQFALASAMAEGEFLDAINYLFEAGYIHLRDCETKTVAAFGLADSAYKRLEAKLTVKGIQLLAPSSGVHDPLVKV